MDHLIWATLAIGAVATAVRTRRRLPPPEDTADVRLRRRLELPDEEGGGDPRWDSDESVVDNNDAVIGRLTEQSNE